MARDTRVVEISASGLGETARDRVEIAPTNQACPNERADDPAIQA